MADLTYTATGRFDETSRKLLLDIYLPKEKDDNPYLFKNHLFDLTKVSLFNKINVVYCQFKLTTDNGDRLNEQVHKHRLEIKIDDLNNYKTEFDFNLEDTLFLLFHDSGKLDLKDLELYYQSVESIYGRVQSTGNFNYLNTNKAKPRVLGMSIIRK